MSWHCHGENYKYSHRSKNLTEIDFPRIILCHGDGKGYDKSRIGDLGYRDYVKFMYGEALNSSDNGWIAQNMSPKALFEHLYSRPFIEDILNPTSFMKLNGSIKEELRWTEIPMVHPEGRCLKLNFTRTKYIETTLIIKFLDTNFSGSLEFTITGENTFYRQTFF